MPKPFVDPPRFGPHGEFPGKGNAFGRPDFVDDLRPFDLPCTPFSVDIGAYDAPAVVDAGTDAFCFTDDFTAASNVRITNFSSNDVINVSNNGSYRYVFGVSELDSNDLVIARTFGTEVSFFLLDDVIPDGAGFIFDYTSAVSAIGFEFLTYDDVTPSPPGGCFEQSLDIDTSGTELVVNAAFAPFCFTDDANVITDVEIFGFSSDDVIEVTNASAHDYNFGTGTNPDDLRITYNDGTNFTNILLTGVLAGSDDLVFNYETAVAAVGYEFIEFSDAPPEPCVEFSIDIGTVTLPGPGLSLTSVDASAEAYCFTDFILAETAVRFTGFSSDDVIKVSGGDEDSYSFGTGSVGSSYGDADDLVITYNDGVNLAVMVIEDVLGPGFVFDYETAADAVGFDFMEFDLTVPPLPEDCTPVTIDVGLPAGSPVVIDASGDDFCFTDDATVFTNVVIQNFDFGDRIEVSEAEIYFFGTGESPNDLRITFNDGVNFTDILIEDILPDDIGFVFDYETATTAVGHDFLIFA